MSRTVRCVNTACEWAGVLVDPGSLDADPTCDACGEPVAVTRTAATDREKAVEGPPETR